MQHPKEMSFAVFNKVKTGKIGVWYLDIEQGKSTLRLGDGFLRMLELPDRFSVMSWEDFTRDLVHPDDAGLVSRTIKEALLRDDTFDGLEFRLKNYRTGQWNWVYGFGSADEISPDGSLIRLSGGVQDIQDRIEAQRARELEHSLNTTLIASLPGSYVVTDAQGIILHCNSHFAELFFPPGRSPEGALWTDVFLPEERAEAQKALVSASGEETRSFTAHALRGNGLNGLFLCQYRCLPENGAPRFLALLFDITQTQKTENQLQRQSSRLDTVIKAANLGTWDWNLLTGEVFYNQTWADIAGLRLEDIQGSVEAWENALLPEDLAGAMEAVDAHVRGETPMYEAEFRMVRPDGTIIWGLDRGRVVERDETGGVIRLMGVLQDITESKRAGEELVRSKNHLELVMRETSFGAWDWNPLTGDILFNDNFFSLLGHGPGEIESSLEAWHARIHPDDLATAQRSLQSLLSGETRQYDCELRMRHKNGQYVWIYDTGHAVEWDAEGRVSRVVGGHFDIQKRKEQEEAQVEALSTIALQKFVLEQTIGERNVLLHRVRERVSDILAATGQLPDEEASSFAEAGELAEAGSVLDMAMGEESPESEDGADNFAESLAKAFDLITEKMWWYKAIIDSIPFPIFVTDREGRWTYLNKPALANVGADDLRDLLGLPSQPWGIDQDAHNRLEDEGPTRAINRFHPELKRFFQGQASFLFDQSGKRIGHIEAMQDVTKIHEADERSRIMLDSMPLACLFWDARFQPIDCNQAAPKLFGKASKQEFLSTIFELSPERQPCGTPSREKILDALERTFQEGYLRLEWMHLLADGTPMPAEATMVRVKHGNEHIVLAYTRDQTELKRKERELDKERRLLVKIMDSSPVCFVMFVRDVIRFATPHAKEFFGIDIGGGIADFYVDEEERTAFLNEVRRVGMINWRIVTVRAADGSVREMLANAFRAEYLGETCVMSWFLDVTEMRETERQLRLARDAAEESTRAKGEFLANMSHEIRTPMNAILGMTRLVLDTVLTDKQRGHLEKAEISARALLRILNDILDFSKIEAGRLEMEISDFDLREVLRDIMEMFRMPAAASGLELRLCVEDGAQRYLRGDPLRLRQILINLVGNAIKFTSKGGVSITVSMPERDEQYATLRFSVRDTGIGLTKAQRDKLFSPFTQADSSTTRRYGGTGLGLVISKRMVEMMQGEISCVSEKDNGAEFIFTAVFEPSTAERVRAPAGDSGAGTAPGRRPDSPLDRMAPLKGKRILVAEDNEINQIVAREMLEGAGFLVELACDGRQAVDMALANPYDLIFMDIQMPGMDGLAAAQELRGHSRLDNLPVVAMTAHAMVGDREKSLAVGMNDHITKPIDSNEVFTVIAKWLSGENKARTARVAPPSPNDPEFSFLQEHSVSQLPSSLPGIDVASGLARVAGNQKLYVKLLRHVAGDAASTIQKLTDAIGEGNAQAIREIAHSLKGASANLSITGVAEAAEHVELAAKAEDLPAVVQHMDALENALQALVSVMDTLKDL